MATTLTSALRKHWPEYLIEGWALGTFMVSAGLVATLLGAPASPLHRALPDPLWRNAAGGIAMDSPRSRSSIPAGASVPGLT